MPALRVQKADFDVVPIRRGHSGAGGWLRPHRFPFCSAAEGAMRGQRRADHGPTFC